MAAMRPPGALSAGCRVLMTYMKAPAVRSACDLTLFPEGFPMKDDIVIVSATRTPVGAFNGAFATVPAHELGRTAIKGGLERAGVEGARGQESMSVAPHCAYLRSGVKMGDFQMIDTMIRDGLWDAFNGYHMGN